MDIHFAEPQWVYLLWAVLAFVALLAWLEFRGRDALDRFMGKSLRSRLLSGPSTGQRAARIIFLGLTGAFLTLALMRPQWGLELVESRRAGTEIMICLDVSRSMLAEDVAPNRLDRAKAEIRDLLGWLDGDQVGLLAFAGRASVLSPLTPDFGFLRLALEDASPGSVTRGGTRLEEPIRKAIAGFGDTGEVARSILLITDGEDHDSFPLQAAKDAAARGIRILAVGFGAEAGAEIPITDPATGARTLLKNADGVVVRSRLDGDLLRQMALLTDGAYIPAGTGLLDLESIYRRHIKPLTRGRLEGGTRAVRNDAFQWAVLLGLLALLGATLSTARNRGRPRKHGNAAAIAVALGLSALSLTSSLPALAQSPAPAQAPVTDKAGASEETPVDAGSKTGSASEQATAATPDEVPDDARAAYNEGVSKIEGADMEAATRLLEAAREKAGTDAETRFRATYNLGWAEVKTADTLIESTPAAALDRLNRAATWFREAVNLRPANDDARYNLEIVMRRALELADSIAAHDEGDLRAHVDALIEDQRSFLATLREGVAAQQAAPDTNVTPDLRRDFRGLAARELTVLADAERLSDQAARELEGIKAKPDEDRTPKEALRAARLEALVGHVHRGRERIAQARTRLRRLQGEQAYRRAAAALGSFRRARDQLLDPVARIDALLADGTEVAQLTGLKAALERGINSLQTPVTAPGWLTPTYLADSQARLESRTAELHTGLASGLAAHDPSPVATAGEPDQAAEQAHLVEKLRAATPLIEDARHGFESAVKALSTGDLNDALKDQRVALEALAAAREQFLDLRGLIELVYGEEQRVATLIAEPPREDTDPAAAGQAPPVSGGPSAHEAMALGASLHERNLERTVRLGGMLSDALAEALAPGEQGSSAATGVTPAAPAGGGERERLERAYELLRQAQDAMNEATGAFAEVTATAAGEPAPAKAPETTRSSVAQAIAHLEELRRLFFNIIEHLQDAARRQQGLADDTETLAALDNAAAAAGMARRAGPIGHRQDRLAAAADGISEALRTEAKAPPPEGAPETGPAEASDTERLTQAADLVAKAGGAMHEAAKQLAPEQPALNKARDAQDQALGALNEAIALLQPPQKPPENNSDQQKQPQQAEQPEAGDKGEQQRKKDEDAAETDLSQLLQGVRDREASRREERAKTRNRGYEPVEKDW